MGRAHALHLLAALSQGLCLSANFVVLVARPISAPCLKEKEYTTIPLALAPAKRTVAPRLDAMQQMAVLHLVLGLGSLCDQLIPYRHTAH